MKEDPVAHFKTIEQNSWALTYLYPEFFSHGKLPSPKGLQTSTTTLEFNRVFKVDTEGKFLAYFSPVTETFASYTNGEIFADLEEGDINQYMVYADNGKGSVNLTNNMLNDTSSWNYAHGPSTKLNSFFKQLRVVGAYIELSVMDVLDNYKGIVESCEYFEIAGNGISSEEINVTKLLSYPRYKAQKPNEIVRMVYRKNNSKLDEFGPYEPFTTLPFFLFHGHDLSPNATVNVKYEIHIEGVVLPHVSHFATKNIYIPKPYTSQKQTIRDKQARSEDFERSTLYSEKAKWMAMGFTGYTTWLGIKRRRAGKIFKGQGVVSYDFPVSDKEGQSLVKRGQDDQTPVKPRIPTTPISPMPKLKDFITSNTNPLYAYYIAMHQYYVVKRATYGIAIENIKHILAEKNVFDDDIEEYVKKLPEHDQDKLMSYYKKKNELWEHTDGHQLEIEMMKKFEPITQMHAYIYRKLGKNLPGYILSKLERARKSADEKIQGPTFLQLLSGMSSLAALTAILTNNLNLPQVVAGAIKLGEQM